MQGTGNAWGGTSLKKNVHCHEDARQTVSEDLKHSHRASSCEAALWKAQERVQRNKNPDFLLISRVRV